jgi:hypothetical protein
MKLLPSFKSAKALALTAVTIATAMVSSIAPSQAEQPTNVVRTFASQNFVHFQKAGQSFGLPDNCPAVSKLFSGAPLLYLRSYENVPGRIVGSLSCNSELRTYTSPAFRQNAGVVIINSEAFYVRDSALLKAMNVKPIELDARAGKLFLRSHSRLSTNVTLETPSATPAPPVTPKPPTPPVTPKPPAPPVTPPPAAASSISVLNLGAYVIRYNVTYDMNGSSQNFDSGDITVGKKVVLSIPPQATKIEIKTRYYTGFFAQTAQLFSRSFGNSHSNRCFTTSGDLFKMKVDDICN